jgi:hypothetical protein
MAGTPNSKLKMAMNVSVSPKWLGCVKSITQQMPGGVEEPLMSQIGKHHGTTKSTNEIQNHHRRSVLNRVSVIARCRLTPRITDRRRKRALAANPASEKPGTSKLQRGAAVRVDPLVGRKSAYTTHGKAWRKCASPMLNRRSSRRLLQAQPCRMVDEIAAG